MGQVPFRTSHRASAEGSSADRFKRIAPPLYGVIGNGRVARHFRHYLSLLEIPLRSWSRDEGLPLDSALADCEVLVLLISDDAIESFYREHAPFFEGRRIVHFSGSLETQHLPGAHPLFTFGPELHSLAEYAKIPFVLESESLGRTPPRLADLLPGLPNPSFAIPPHEKARYHALCVLAGNFSQLLWLKLFEDFETRLGLPREAAMPYLEQTFSNLAAFARDRGASPLTGPLARGDSRTLARNLAALEGDPFQSVYQAFVIAYADARAIPGSSPYVSSP